MGKPECQELCTEIHEGDTSVAVRGKLRVLRIHAALLADGLPGLWPEDEPRRCPRSGYVLTRWDKIRDWLLGYR